MRNASVYESALLEICEDAGAASLILLRSSGFDHLSFRDQSYCKARN
jgi:hypothetical protein